MAASLPADPMVPNDVLLTTYYSLLTTHYSLLTTHYLLLLLHHYLLLATHYSLLTTGYLLLTTHYSRAQRCATAKKTTSTTGTGRTTKSAHRTYSRTSDANPLRPLLPTHYGRYPQSPPRYALSCTTAHYVTAYGSLGTTHYPLYVTVTATQAKRATATKTHAWTHYCTTQSVTCWTTLARKAPLLREGAARPSLLTARKQGSPPQRGRSPPLPFPADIFNAYCGGSGGSLTTCDWIALASHPGRQGRRQSRRVLAEERALRLAAEAVGSGACRRGSVVRHLVGTGHQ